MLNTVAVKDYAEHGCGAVCQNSKAFYEALNKDEPNLEVVIVSGDRNEAGFQKTMSGFPWVAVPFGEKRPAIESAVPCTGCVPLMPPC